MDDPRGEDLVLFRVLLRLRSGVNPGGIEQAVGKSIRQVKEREYLLLNASVPSPIPADVVQSSLGWIYEGRYTLEPAGRRISGLRTKFSQALKLLMSGVLVLLLSVCANVTGLLS